MFRLTSFLIHGKFYEYPESTGKPLEKNDVSRRLNHRGEAFFFDDN
jgi:hypothetical protein